MTTTTTMVVDAATCIDSNPHAPHLIAGTWRDWCPGRATPEMVHRVVSAWKGDEPGSAGFECACGDTFDGFNTIVEAESCHKPLKDPRTEYIAGLRALADLLEQNPDLELPGGKNKYEGLSVAIFGDNQRERLAAWTRALPGEKRKGQSGSNGDILSLSGQLRGLHVRIICDRDEVCERVVVGTKIETKVVRDPEALKAIPEVEVTEEVEIVEWRCTSILAGATP